MTQNNILGQTKKENVCARVCMPELQQSTQKGQGNKPVTMAKFQTVAPCQYCLLEKCVCVCVCAN